MEPPGTAALESGQQHGLGGEESTMLGAADGVGGKGRGADEYFNPSGDNFRRLADHTFVGNAAAATMGWLDENVTAANPSDGNDSLTTTSAITA